MKYLMLISLMFFMGCSGCAGKKSASKQFAFKCEKEPCKNLLSIGDSISMGGPTGNTFSGYLPFLADNLKQKYNVNHPYENCRNTTYTLAKLDSWLSQFPNPDVVVWNDGIWNTVRDSVANLPGNDPSQYGTTLEVYETQIKQIATRLLQTNARVIFLTSTRLDSSVEKDFETDKINQLNDIAKSVLPTMGIEVYDLNAVSYTIQSDQFDGIHYNANGSKVLADGISSFVNP